MISAFASFLLAIGLQEAIERGWFAWIPDEVIIYIFIISGILWVYLFFTWTRITGPIQRFLYSYLKMNIVLICVLAGLIIGPIIGLSVGLVLRWWKTSDGSQIDSSRPRLVGYLDGQPRLASLPNESESLLVVKIVVTNSGTPSIAHDWRVYLSRPGVGIERLQTMVDTVPIEYLEPGKVVPTFTLNPEEYIQYTTRKAIPTGHARFGVLVSKTKTLTTEAFSEAVVIIRFRDVLDREYDIRGGLRVTGG